MVWAMWVDVIGRLQQPGVLIQNLQKFLVSGLQAHWDTHSCLNPNKTMQNENDFFGIGAAGLLVIIHFKCETLYSIYVSI